ncbi:MAG: rhomboid protease GluP [Acidobacteriota bacterium]|nr:rhomboid protease GluP [Acidobacteriota bacterium]
MPPSIVAAIRRRTCLSTDSPSTLKRASVRFRAEDTTPGPRFGWPVTTCALIASNVAAWGAVAYVYGLSPIASQNSELLLRVGAINGTLLGAGEWWRIVTSQFLHVHFAHLVFNMIALFTLGRMLEPEFGAARLLAMYFCGGAVGQLASVLVAPALVGSGASQAVMGLAGSAAVVLFRRPHARTMRLIVLLVYVVIQIALDLFAVDYVKAGHVCGFIAGAVLGRVLLRSRA